MIARRRRAAHQGGLWEFPGGKLEPGETAAQAAVREAREETGLCVTAGSERAHFQHTYADRRLHFIAVDCHAEAGEAAALASEEIRWVLPRELSAYAFPAANHALVEALTRITQAHQEPW